MKLHRGSCDDMTKISVIIPTYNRANLIGKSIQSVLNQTYQDFEIIVVDDSSTDSTEDVIKNLDDLRIIYIRHKENKGPSAARNTGIKVANGEYIAFQDSDDEWFPEKLEKQLDLFNNSAHEVGVVYSGFYRIEPDKKRYIPLNRVTQKEGNIHNELLKGNFIGAPAVLIKKKCFEKTNFDEDLHALEDWDLWIGISKYYDFRYINQALFQSYYTQNSVSTDQNKTIDALKIILMNHLDDFNKHKKILSKHYFKIGVRLCSNGDLKNGRDYLIKAVNAHYLNIKALLMIFISFLGQNMVLKITMIYYKFN